MLCRRRHRIALACLTLVLTFTSGADAQEQPLDRAHQWPQWRGPLATGAAPHADPPARWSEDKHIRWKAELPGLGHSSPIVWGDRVYLTAAAPVGDAMPPRFSGRPGAHDNLPVTHKHRFDVLALDRATGKTLWRTKVNEQVPREGGHETASLASASPVTDGQHVYAFFGSYGLYCIDRDGRIVWQVDLGDMHTKHGHGEGSSPALHGHTLVVNWDHEGDSFIVAMDKMTGDEVWRRERDEATSWSTPLIVEHEGEPQVIVNATKIRS